MPIQRARDYVEHLKSKPEHVRQRVALASSGLITGLVVVGWLVALTSSGTLALSSEPQYDDITVASQESAEDFSNLLGAAGAFRTGLDGAGSVTVVETTESSTLEQEDSIGERTVIPF